MPGVQLCGDYLQITLSGRGLKLAVREGRLARSEPRGDAHAHANPADQTQRLLSRCVFPATSRGLAVTRRPSPGDAVCADYPYSARALGSRRRGALSGRRGGRWSPQRPGRQLGQFNNRRPVHPRDQQLDRPPQRGCARVLLVLHPVPRRHHRGRRCGDLVEASTHVFTPPQRAGRHHAARPAGVLAVSGRAAANAAGLPRRHRRHDPRVHERRGDQRCRAVRRAAVPAYRVGPLGSDRALHRRAQASA